MAILYSRRRSGPQPSCGSVPRWDMRWISVSDETAQLAAVVSVAMPNCNPCIKDAPCDKPDSHEEYTHLIEKKFVAALGAARLAGANVVIMPDAGCGVYGNNPSEVGRLFAKVVQDSFKGTFDEIHLVCSPEFSASAKSTGCNSACE